MELNLIQLAENLRTFARTVKSRFDGKLDKDANAISATALKDPFTLTVQGDVRGSTSITGDKPVTIQTTHVETGVIPGTYPKVVVDSKGRVTEGRSLVAADIPSLDAGTIASGIFPIGRIPELPVGKITDLNSILDSKISLGQAATSAIKLETPRLINGVLDDGSTNIEIRRVKGLLEVYGGLTANTIDLSEGNLFTVQVTGPVSLSVIGAAPAGTVSSFTLELVNGGAAAINWWNGLKWPGGQPPSLTVTGLDILGFYTRDGGVTYNGFLISGDVR